MKKVTKTIEAESKEVKTIKPEQLKAIKDQQAKLQNLPKLASALRAFNQMFSRALDVLHLGKRVLPNL